MKLVLLGAGAARGAGIPTALEMTQRVHQEIREHGRGRDLHAFRLVAGGLLHRIGGRGEDPFRGIDIEDLVRATQLLADRDSLEVAPFIGSWQHEIDQIDTSPALVDAIEALERRLSERINLARESAIREATSKLSSSGRSLGFMSVGDHQTKELLHKAFGAAQNRGSGDAFRALLDRLLLILCNIVWLEAGANVDYLSPLFDLADAQGRLVVASLNYDNAIELCAATTGRGCSLGLERWSDAGEVTVATSGVTLLKLHGSIDWRLDEPQDRARPNSPRQPLLFLDAGEVKKRRSAPAVIFGGRNKLTASGPFLDLFVAFRRALRQATELIVVGYSFRDEHVNKAIAAWLSSGADNMMTVVDPAAPSPLPATAFDWQLNRRVKPVRQAAELALADVCSLTESTELVSQ